MPGCFGVEDHDGGVARSYLSPVHAASLLCHDSGHTRTLGATSHAVTRAGNNAGPGLLGLHDRGT